MQSEYPFNPRPVALGPENGTKVKSPISRLTDEKISDESGAEAKVDSALAPTGLSNPFWN